MAAYRRELTVEERTDPCSPWVFKGDRRRPRPRPLSAEQLRLLNLSPGHGLAAQLGAEVAHVAAEVNGPETLLRLVEEIQRLRQDIAALRIDGGKVSVFDLDEAAAFLKTHRRTVERYIAAGQLRAPKLAEGKQGSRRVQRAELERFLEERS